MAKAQRWRIELYLSEVVFMRNIFPCFTFKAETVHIALPTLNKNYGLSEAEISK